MISGRVLYVEDHEIWSSVGRKLLISNDGGRTWALRAILPMTGLREHFSVNRLGRRLARSGYHHFVKTGADSGLIIAHKHIFQLRPGDKLLHRTAHLQGSRPLSISWSDDKLYYGEYRSNSERSPINIFSVGSDGRDWEVVWRFEKVRHVHGVFLDPYTSDIWVTTGDDDSESAIWRTRDQFQTLDCIIGGSQQHRAVQLLFSEDWIYFGSDAPGEKNHIYRINRKTGSICTLCAVSGPVFYGTKVGTSMFFSTVVEPSEVNTGFYSEVWGSTDGQTWKLIKCFRKDIYPMKYFQYGQVYFPSGPGDGRNLWCFPMATEFDQQTLKIPITDFNETSSLLNNVTESV